MAQFKQSQRQVQAQRQIQKLSQRQIQAVRMLSLSARDLRQEILNEVNENPALTIVRDPLAKKDSRLKQRGQSPLEKTYISAAGDVNSALDSHEGYGETLQQHLMTQLNMMPLSADEYDLSQKLIYNLDKNGCYGSMLAPETLIDKSRPLQNKNMLERCIERIQRMDPVGLCCKTPEESLYIQAKIAGDAPAIALFLLNGHLEMLNPPTPERVIHKLNVFISDYKKKSFGARLEIDEETVTQKAVENSISYILRLNPHPAGDFVYDTAAAEFEQPDIVLNVVRVEGHLNEDDFSSGKIAADGSFYFQVKYASGILPEVRLTSGMDFDKSVVEQAKAFLGNLQFRQNTIVLQGCAIVKGQKEFFEKGPGHIAVLSRKQVATQLQIHESTVSRMSAKKSSKYIQTEWGLFPASYFFSSGVSSESSKKVSEEVIQHKIQHFIETAEAKGQVLSDNKLAQLLNAEGIAIARRTVSKYRQNAGIKNSYGK